MSTVSFGRRKIEIDEISASRLGYDVSWISDCPWTAGSYAIGTMDGRVEIVDDDLRPLFPAAQASPSGEAVNGVAFDDGLMAVSTRRELTFVNVPPLGERTVGQAVYDVSGAHGVSSIAGGSLAAPLGANGILLARMVERGLATVRVMPGADESFYAYKTVGLTDSSGAAVIATAGRKTGFYVAPLVIGAGSADGTGRLLRGFDFVDVAGLGIPNAPFAIAALSVDGSVHLARDPLKDRRPITLDLSSLGERAYRLAVAQGHLFLLTDRTLWVVRDLVRRFEAGVPAEELANVRLARLPVEAVDLTISQSGSLFLVTADSACLWRLKIDDLIQGETTTRKFPVPGAGDFGIRMTWNTVETRFLPAA